MRPRFGHWVAPASAAREFLVTNPGDDAFISPRDANALRTLSTLSDEVAGYPGAKLVLFACSSLESLEGIETADTLRSVSLTSCGQVRTLAPLAGLPLRELSVLQCAALEDVEAIASLHALETLSLVRCPRIRGLPPIGLLPNLRAVSLFGFDSIPERFRRQLTSPELIRELQEFVRSERASSGRES